MEGQKPEIWGMHLALNCARCGGEVPLLFSWDTVKAGFDPADHLLASIRDSWTEHLKLNLCSINLKKKLEEAAGWPVQIKTP